MKKTTYKVDQNHPAIKAYKEAIVEDQKQVEKYGIEEVTRRRNEALEKTRELNMDMSKVTRLEVVDHYNNTGRELVSWEEDLKIELSLQDEGRTLKIFKSRRPLKTK